LVFPRDNHSIVFYLLLNKGDFFFIEAVFGVELLVDLGDEFGPVDITLE